MQQYLENFLKNELTCKSTDSAPFKKPGAGVSPVVLEVVIFNLTIVAIRLAIEGIPADPHADVRRHRPDWLLVTS